MPDKETLAVYARSADDYAKAVARTPDDAQEQDLQWFLSDLPEAAHLLDLGSGPGHWAARFSRLGHMVTATDASAEMAALAQQTYGLTVRIEAFDAFRDLDAYDGIWANFSLLHLPRSDLPDMLHRLHRALHKGGRLHLALKLGEGEGRDRLGRFYAYYQPEELRDLLHQAGFSILRERQGKSVGLAGGLDPYIVVSAHG